MTTKPCDAESLRKWQSKGVVSDVLDARLQFMEAEGIARYVRALIKKNVTRVHPNMLPTQASGRWSTTNPPLVNFPKHSPEQCARCRREGKELWCPRDVRRIFLPDAGSWWLHFDKDAIEARISAALCGDVEDLTAFDNHWDIHTLTACQVFGWALPPIKTKLCHTDPSCEAWRQSIGWGGEDDRRRHLVKTLRYALQYALDEKGALQSHELFKLGLTRQEVLKFARKYLAAKPRLVATKRRVWEEALRTGVNYTVLGRRRRLFGSPHDKMKVAWSHMISGTVTDMVNSDLIQITTQFPECHLVLNSHDGLTISFPQTFIPSEVMSIVKPITERSWQIGTLSMLSPCTWEFLWPDGTVTRP